MQPQQWVLDGCCGSGKYICCILHVHVRIMTVQKKPISKFQFDFVKNDNNKWTVIHTQWCATPSEHAVDQAFAAETSTPHHMIHILHHLHVHSMICLSWHMYRPPLPKRSAENSGVSSQVAVVWQTSVQKSQPFLGKPSLLHTESVLKKKSDQWKRRKAKLPKQNHAVANCLPLGHGGKKRGKNLFYRSRTDQPSRVGWLGVFCFFVLFCLVLFCLEAKVTLKTWKFQQQKKCDIFKLLGNIWTYFQKKIVPKL